MLVIVKTRVNSNSIDTPNQFVKLKSHYLEMVFCISCISFLYFNF